VLNFEKLGWGAQFRLTPPSPEVCFLLLGLEPGQNLTETKVRLITNKIVVEGRIIPSGLRPGIRF